MFRRIVFWSCLVASLFAIATREGIAQMGYPGLNRGVNFGNMLEAPFEGAWGLTMREEFFDKVVEGGFDHIRLPVSWTHHAAATSPFTINPTFFARVDWALRQAERRGLKVILNMHHYDSLNANPVAENLRALMIWRQIAQRYRDRGDFLVFEILNEPHNQFSQQPQLWNNFMNEALNVIRKFHPHRPVLVGPVHWNSIDALTSTNFKPPKDNNIVLTVHYYEPFAFTHQGASWINPSPPTGTTWHPDRHQIASPWQNWSWSTSVTEGLGGLQVKYNAGWAGFYLHSDLGINAPTELRISVNQARSFRIVTRNADQERVYYLNTGANGGDYTINLDPSIGLVTDIFLQNNTASATDPFVLSRFEIEGNQTQSLIWSQFEEVSAALTRAKNWAAARDLPIYLGEFGAFEAGDMDSRAAWTTSVRSEAERLNMGWGYWEFGAGFGVYNPNNSTWRMPLLNALIPQYP
jgi:hypothetical protein